MLEFLYCLNYKLGGEISHINFNSKNYDKLKYKFALKLIWLITASNLFQLEVLQKGQHCLFCVLWKNSIMITYEMLNNDTFLYLATMFPSGL